MAAFEGPARATRFACSAREKIRASGLQFRAGLHTGECELIGDDLRGIAVDIAAWVTSLADPAEIRFGAMERASDEFLDLVRDDVLRIDVGR
jgi:class 3 adenylate cyclase